MKSVAQVLVGPGEFERRELEIPPPGPGQLRMRVHACGICGSDKMLSQISAPGTILGHEVIAEVESVGPGVKGWQPGDRVIPIGEDLGMSDHRGGFSEWIVIPERGCIRVPASVPSLQGVIAEPVANGLHFVRRSRLQPGQLVAILGAGQIGLSILYWARRLGAARIVASEPVPARAQLARELGADAVVDPRQQSDVGEAIFAALGGRPQVVFEAVGRPEVMKEAIAMPGSHGGVVVLAGIMMEEISISPLALSIKETDLVFPIGTVREEVEVVVAALAAGEVPAERFVSHRIHQNEIPAVMRELGKPTDYIKVVVDYT